MTERPSQQDYDVIIAGGGPAGLASALSFARFGWKVCVVEHQSTEKLAHPAFDGREIALTHHSRHWLQEAGVWSLIPATAVCPLEIARIESGEAGGAPLLFSPLPETGNGEPLGYLVANHLIRRALYERVCQVGQITLKTGLAVQGFKTSLSEVVVTLTDGEVARARLLVAADGRFSKLRHQAGIGEIIHDFGTDVMVCRVQHEKSHDNTALQWFDENQTIALLPVSDESHEKRISSLVLTLPSAEIARLKEAAPESFSHEVTERTHERLGALKLVSPRVSYPLKAVYAHRFHARRFVLIGDAAVGMHPITAHGFNLGLKGQETLVKFLAQGSGDPGDRHCLEAFSWRHRKDTFPLFAATNMIAATYTRDEMPFLLARRIGLRIADRLTPFKRAVTHMLMDPAA